jgi:hypothetical protein
MTKSFAAHTHQRAIDPIEHTGAFLKPAGAFLEAKTIEIRADDLQSNVKSAGSGVEVVLGWAKFQSQAGIHETCPGRCKHTPYRVE